MIEIKALNKSFGKLQVLKDINLELEEGKIYGILGRNGVGKTTLLNIMSNKIKQDSGEVRIFGGEVFENRGIVENIVMISEQSPELKDMKIKDIFHMAATLYKNWDEDYKELLVKRFNVDIRKKYEKLSEGNQTIIGLILGLASRARLTIFDEPSVGLDAAFRDEFYTLLLKDFEENPRTIIISTHLIDEVKNVFEEIIILKDKKVYLQDEVENILEKAYVLNGKENIVDKFAKNKRVVHREEFGTNIFLAIFDDLSSEEKEELENNNIRVLKIPLQKLFVYLTDNKEDEDYE